MVGRERHGRRNGEGGFLLPGTSTGGGGQGDRRPRQTVRRADHPGQVRNEWFHEGASCFRRYTLLRSTMTTGLSVSADWYTSGHRASSQTSLSRVNS